MESIRELIIQDIDTALAELTTANGFNCNCGANRERGRRSWEDADLPCMSIFPAVEAASRSAYGMDKMVMPVRVDMLDNYTSETASVKGEKMLADVKDAIRQARATLLTGYISDIQYTGGGIEEYPELKTKTVGVTASFNITYETKLGDPYNQ